MDPSIDPSDVKTIRKLGQGSFGQVWLAKHLPTSTLVCLKAIDDGGGGDGSGRAGAPTLSPSCAQEVETLKQLCHINCVRYMGSFRLGGSLFIAMQYADGGDLAGRIKEAAEAQTPFSEHQVLRWFGQLCLGLQHMHGLRLLHRDLKPQNVLLRRHPLGDRLLIGDVGISKALTHTLDQAHTAIGTPSYLAPEVYQSQPYGFAADVWSLGCLLFELANLQQAFRGRSLNELSLTICTGRTTPLRAGVSTALSDLMYDILQVNPTRRPTVLALLHSPLLAPHVQAFAAEVLAEDEGGRGSAAQEAADAPGRAALRWQLEECGLRPTADAFALSAPDVEREQRLLAVLARLRREREARLATPVSGGGGEETASTHTRAATTAGADAAITVRAGLSEPTSPCTPAASSPAFSSPGSPEEDGPAVAPVPPESPSSPPTTLAQRIHKSHAFLERVLGEQALRRAYGLVGLYKGEGLEGRLAAEVFAGRKGMYLGMFLHLVALEGQQRSEQGQARSPYCTAHAV